MLKASHRSDVDAGLPRELGLGHRHECPSVPDRVADLAHVVFVVRSHHYILR